MDLNRILSELKTERDRLNSAIAALGEITAPRNKRRKPKAARVKQKRRRRMSAAGRAKLARLMKQRWAARKKAGKTKL